MKYQLHYMVNNGGDGSANVRFYDTRELADFMDDLQQDDGEGWGESSSGSIDIEGDNIKFDKDVDTKETVLTRYALDVIRYSSSDPDEYRPLAKFIKAFYPEKLPTFNVIAKGKYFSICINGKEVKTEYPYKKVVSDGTALKLETELNSLYAKLVAYKLTDGEEDEA